jgi:hypothetical protein
LLYFDEIQNGACQNVKIHFGRDQTVDIPNFSGTTYLAITQHLQKGPNYIDPAGAVSRGQINFTFSVFCQRFDILPTTCDSALERRAHRRGQTGSYASVTSRRFGTYLSCQNTCLGSSSANTKQGSGVTVVYKISK